MHTYIQTDAFYFTCMQFFQKPKFVDNIYSEIWILRLFAEIRTFGIPPPQLLHSNRQLELQEPQWCSALTIQ